jgi:hypothetical protein
MFSVTVCAYNLAQAQGASTVFLLFFEHFFDRATWRKKAGFARFFGGSKSVQDTNSSFCHFKLSQNATVARNGRRFFASEPASAGCHRWIKQLQGQSGSLWN